jgi:hemerythrin-like domain-containing protein
MPVQIGSSAHSFSDPTGLLSDCHRRIEMFLGSLLAIAELSDANLTEEAKRALDAALRYFREAAPKHTADEEDSLFPRMRKVDHPDARAAMESLDALEHDHRAAESLHAQADKLGQQCLEMGKLSAAEAAEFKRVVFQLAGIYKQHIRTEDELVFPVAARLLSAGDRAAVGREMAARRSVRAPK